jgi:hypothetical protein
MNKNILLSMIKEDESIIKHKSHKRELFFNVVFCMLKSKNRINIIINRLF